MATNGELELTALRELPGFLPYGAANNFRAVTVADHSNMILAGAYTDAVNMAQDFAVAMHQPLVYAEAYRSLEIQNVRAIEHQHGGPLAATPGTSNHGWALAVDYRNGIGGGPGNSTYNWMAANAGKYGFVRDVSSEYWHWHHPSSTSITKPRVSTAGVGGTVLLPDTTKDDKMVYYVQLSAASTDPRYGKLAKGLLFVIDPFARTMTKLGSSVEATVAKATGAKVVAIAGNQAWELVTSGGLKRKGW